MHGFAEHGVNPFGRDVADRNQHKGPQVHSLMGHRQRVRSDDPVIEEKNIQIDDPGTEAHDFQICAQIFLHRFESAQQGQGVKVGFDFRGPVDKPVLIEIVHRFGAVKGRHTDHRCQTADRDFPECPVAVAHLVPYIGADGQQNPMPGHDQLPPRSFAGTLKRIRSESGLGA